MGSPRVRPTIVPTLVTHLWLPTILGRRCSVPTSAASPMSTSCSTGDGVGTWGDVWGHGGDVWGQRGDMGGPGGTRGGCLGTREVWRGNVRT